MIGQRGAESPDPLDIQAQMPGTIRSQVARGELEKPHSRACAAGILGVVGPMKLLLKVNKGASELNEPLIESVIRVAVLKP